MTSATTRRRAALAGAGLAITGMLASGCGPTFANLPLPGAGVGGDTTELKFQFDQALNLAEGATVKVNGVDFGKVQKVETKNFKAIITADMKKAAEVRSDATARLRYSTPLGELYIDVRNPDQGTVLNDGQMLSPKRSTVAPTVEDALSQASLLINGGGLAQLQTVTSELNDAIGGREQTVRQLMERSSQFVTAANGSTADIVNALDALSRVSVTLKANQTTINRALREIRPAAAVLRQNTPGFTRLLHQVNLFAQSANNIVGSTRQDLLTMINQISPILDEMLANRPVLSRSLRALTSASHTLDQIFPGDYWNLSAKLQVDSLLSLLNLATTAPTPTAPAVRGTKPAGSAPSILPNLGTITSGGGLTGLANTVTSLLGGK